MAGFLIARQSVPSGTPAKGCHCYQQSLCASSPVAKPPAGSSLLFGALADSGRIKERKNGSYRMVLKGVDEVNWFTDRPERFGGRWKPQKLVRTWESMFEYSDPNAQASSMIDDERKMMTFEMFKPKYNKRKQRLSFKIDTVISGRDSDAVTGLKSKALNEVTLFIDDASVDSNGPDSGLVKMVKALFGSTPAGGWDLSWADLTDVDLRTFNLTDANLTNANLTGANLTNAFLSGTNLTKANLSNANLEGANMAFANLTNTNLTGANLTNSSFQNANLTGASLTGANLNVYTWDNTTCPDGTMNSGSSPCTAEQLNLA